MAVPASGGETLAFCHRVGRVLRQECNGDVIALTVRLPVSRTAAVARFIVPEPS